tara:strand:+ start:2399 stop:2713 length:315 start_codon:yes stop_codon:yes gene_type:complete
MELLYFVLCCYGMTSIIVYSHIARVPREYFSSKSVWLCELLSCSMCTGFWVGAFLCGINNYTELFNFDCNFVNFLLLGSLGAGTSYMLDTIVDDEGIKIKYRGE